MNHECNHSQESSISGVYVNITQETLETADITDSDGHDVHIHLPHSVLRKLAQTRQDHVIHIGIIGG